MPMALSSFMMLTSTAGWSEDNEPTQPPSAPGHNELPQRPDRRKRLKRRFSRSWKEEGMALFDNLPQAYRAAKLMDSQIPHQEIAARTGLTGDDVSSLEELAKDLSDSASADGYGGLTATEALTFSQLINLRYPAGRPGDIFRGIGTTEVLSTVDAFEPEENREIAEILDSFIGKGILSSADGTRFVNLLSRASERDIDPDELENLLLEYQAWEGPRSRLVDELQNPDLSGPDAKMAGALIYQVLGKDTLRIMMDLGDFQDILERTMAGEPSGVNEGFRWPHPRHTYIEFPGPLHIILGEDAGVLHGIIIIEESGQETKTVMIPATQEGWPGVMGVRLNIRTGAFTRLFGPAVQPDQIIELVRRLAFFVADERTEIVEMPLTRRARRRLRRSGQPNPWHVAQHRRP